MRMPSRTRRCRRSLLHDRMRARRGSLPLAAPGEMFWRLASGGRGAGEQRLVEWPGTALLVIMVGERLGARALCPQCTGFRGREAAVA